MEQDKGKLELIATQRVNANSEMYKVVDFLNKNLKNYHLMFGLTKKDESMVISIYEVE
ncbi:YpmA family protein [Desulfitobacterium sp. AusDCA]|uniref:YpmA family protein n=1 Tax=Desulfitobacterium sp. AusDCA TaxID=3240383 RepID=UPI003DA76114